MTPTRLSLSRAVALGLAPVPLAVALALAAGSSDAPDRLNRLLPVLVLMGLALAVTSTRPGLIRGEQRGEQPDPTAGHDRWARRRLLLLPALLAVLPLVGGVRLPADSGLAVLVVGYAATGVYEELWFRGVVLGALRSVPPVRAAVVSGVLFGSAHLTNIAFGANPAITAAQVVGATCFGIGYAAVRLRTGVLVPLMVLHFVGDLTLSLSALPPAAFWGLMVGHDLVLLVLGLVILRPLRRPHTDHRPTAADVVSTPAATAGAQPA